MNIIEIFIDKTDNCICFNCNSKNTYRYKNNKYSDTYYKSYCRDCNSSIYFHRATGESECIIRINKEYYFTYDNWDGNLILMKDAEYFKIDGSDLELGKMPVELINNLPIKYSDIEKYIILL